MAGPNLAPRTRLGPYLLGRKLGSGGMATVYAARQESAHVKRLVALKVLAANLSKDDPDHRRFMREAHVATRLEHPNIVRTYDVGELDGRMYLAMELLHGATLGAWASASAAPLPVGIAVEIVLDVARALHAAHELVDPERGALGVVHQDVSPQNILVGYDGVVKLLDFGVARLAALEGSRTESLQGKPSYLSPEQVNGKNIDRRTDVFALGVVFWELLTGTRLFKRETATATYIAVLQDPIPDPASVNAAVPRPIADVVMTALSRDRDARYATAEDLRRALATARAAAGVPEVTDEDVARWIRLVVPPSFTPADVEREIVAQSSPSFPEATQVDQPVPDLVVPQGPPRRLSSSAMSAAVVNAPAPSLGPAPVSAPPPSSRRMPAAAAAAKAAPSISFGGDEDDFDMEIERNVATSAMPPATGGRPSGGPLALAGAPRAAVSSSGLEVAHVRATSRRDDDDEAPSTAMLIVGHAVSFVVLAGVTAALFRFVHRAGGHPVTNVLPRAFDGSSAPESGVFALASLAVAVAVGFAGVKLTPRSWALVGSGAAMLLVSLAMVTVTLASTGENPEPPDGALVVPYLVPLALFLFGLAVGGRAANLFPQRGVARKLGAIPLAAIAGVIVFVAFEVSRLAK